MKLSELIKGLTCEHSANSVDCEIKGICANSDFVRPGDLFVAVKGQRSDGHNFLKQAIDKGAKTVVIQKDLPVRDGIVRITVNDSRAALACLSARFFGYPAKQLKVIGITGTNGKTTVSYLIESILACAGHPCGVVGTVNYRWGNKQLCAVHTTPGTEILQSFLQEIVLARSKYAIIEVSSHALDQNRVENIDFSTAVFTNLSHEHLDYHGSMDNYFSCKAALFEKLAPQSRAVINSDDVWGEKLIGRINSACISYGIRQSAQIRAGDVRLEADKSRFMVFTPKGSFEISTPLIGYHNIYNILAAISAAFAEGIGIGEIVAGIEGCTCVPGRLQRVDCGQDFSVFVDYAHTGDALQKVLQSLRQISRKRIILVFGCGGDRDKDKRPKMGKIAAELADCVFITSDNPRSENPEGIISGIIAGIDENINNYTVIPDRFAAIQQALAQAQAGDIVLIAGKGHESVQILAGQSIAFDDRKAVEQILQLPITNY